MSRAIILLTCFGLLVAPVFAIDTLLPLKADAHLDTPYHEVVTNRKLKLIDCDLKESIIHCAETIWPKLMRGGRMVFDDYTSEFFRGARLGIEFSANKYGREISEHGLMNRLYYICKK